MRQLKETKKKGILKKPPIGRSIPFNKRRIKKSMTFGVEESSWSRQEEESTVYCYEGILHEGASPKKWRM